MHLAKRATLVAAVLFVSAGLTSCKKQEKDAEKKTDPVVTAGSGTGTGSGSGSGTGTGSGSAAPIATEALKGFKGAMAQVTPSTTGGLGAKLGGLFGGGVKEDAAAAPAAAGDQAPGRHAMGKGQDPSAVAEPAAPPTTDGPKLTFPPAGARGGDCAAVTDRIMIIVEQMMAAELGSLTAEQKAAAKSEIDSQMASVRDEFMKMCTDQSWSQELKDCALTAMSEAEFEKCDQYAPPETEEELEPGEDYPAEPAKPVPAWTGGDDCKAVGDRMMQLATAQVGDIPAESRAEYDKSIAESAVEITNMCASGQWSESVRKCVLQAPTIDAAGECLSQVGGGM